MSLTTETVIIAESYSAERIYHEDGYTAAGWHTVTRFPEDDMNWEQCAKMVAKGNWRFVRETVTREIVLGPKP